MEVEIVSMVHRIPAQCKMFADVEELRKSEVMFYCGLNKEFVKK